PRGGRRRGGDLAGAPRAALRTVLPRGRGPLARAGGHGARVVDRQAPHRADGRHRRRRERAGQGRALHAAPPRGLSAQPSFSSSLPIPLPTPTRFSPILATKSFSTAELMLPARSRGTPGTLAASALMSPRNSMRVPVGVSTKRWIPEQSSA